MMLCLIGSYRIERSRFVLVLVFLQFLTPDDTQRRKVSFSAFTLSSLENTPEIYLTVLDSLRREVSGDYCTREHRLVHEVGVYFELVVYMRRFSD